MVWVTRSPKHRSVEEKKRRPFRIFTSVLSSHWLKLAIPQRDWWVNCLNGLKGLLCLVFSFAFQMRSRALSWSTTWAHLGIDGYQAGLSRMEDVKTALTTTSHTHACMHTKTCTHQRHSKVSSCIMILLKGLVLSRNHSVGGFVFFCICTLLYWLSHCVCPILSTPYSVTIRCWFCEVIKIVRVLWWHFIYQIFYNFT